MATPRRKSKTRTRTRRSHDALKPINFSTCSKCGAPRLPHSVCETCGSYGKLAIPARYLQADLTVR